MKVFARSSISYMICIHAGMARDPVGRLKAMMKKHHIRVSPKGRKHVPEIVKRNLKSKNLLQSSLIALCI